MVYWIAPQWQLAAWTEVEVGSKVGREARKARWVSLSSAIANVSAVFCWRVWRLYTIENSIAGDGDGECGAAPADMGHLGQHIGNEWG